MTKYDLLKLRNLADATFGDTPTADDGICHSYEELAEFCCDNPDLIYALVDVARAVDECLEYSEPVPDAPGRYVAAVSWMNLVQAVELLDDLNGN